MILISLAAVIFVLAVIAIRDGYKRIKESRNFTESKKMKIGYRVASAIHMCCGILIILCYLLAAGLVVINVIRLFEGNIRDFIGILLFWFPFVTLVIIYFLSVCLLLMGITGVIINRLHKKLSNQVTNAIRPWCNASAVVIGLVIAIVPIAIALFRIVSSIS